MKPASSGLKIAISSSISRSDSTERLCEILDAMAKNMEAEGISPGFVDDYLHLVVFLSVLEGMV